MTKEEYEAGRAKILAMPDPFGTNHKLLAQLDARWASEAPLRKEVDAASKFADQAQAGYGQLTAESAALRDQLRGYASGQNSLSAEQLRQGLQQTIAGQQAMAASARPANAPMAALSAMQNAGAAASGLAGQQAMAGIAERQAATQSLGNMIMGQRGQDLNATLQSRDQTIRTREADLGRRREDQAATDAKRAADEERWRQTAYAAGAVMLASDRDLKTKIRPAADDSIRQFMDGLRAYEYEYKNPRDGGGRQLGVMAQDLAKSPLGRQTVIDTPRGKMVHGGKLAGALAAVTKRLGERLAALEQRR